MTAQEVQAQQEEKQAEILEKRVTTMKEKLEAQISKAKPARQFTMPYHITCV